MEKTNIKALFNYCRRGKVNKLKQLIEDGDIELNICDQWDSTPLYYACLCGHEKTVEYLLQNGAKCQANTFAGERCLYAAPTQKIREILKDYRAITKDCIRRDNYVGFFNRCLDNQAYKDFCFVVHGRHFFVHKVILASRSTYFLNMFETKWKCKKYLHIKHELVTISSFQYMLQYVYTDRIDVPICEISDLKRLSRQCHLFELEKKLDEAHKHCYFYTGTKPKMMKDNVSILSIQPEFNSSALSESYMYLMHYCIPQRINIKRYPEELPDIFFIELPEFEQHSSPEGKTDVTETNSFPYTDICFQVSGHTFYGHQLFFRGRSDYFNSLAHFNELSSLDNQRHIPTITLNDVTPEAFAVITTFIYTNQCDIPDETILELLHLSSLYLLPTLKKKCANKLSAMLDCENVVAIYQLSRLYNLTSLETSCCEFMANHLHEVIDSDEFSELVLADATEIKNREETDSIPVIDDIRFQVHNSALPGMQSADFCYGSSADQKFEMLEKLLLRLGLDA